MNIKRMKFSHTKERKNRKNEPIPAPKCPGEERQFDKFVNLLAGIPTFCFD